VSHARKATELPLSPENFRDELARIADAYARGESATAERRTRLADTLRALATVLREAVTVLARVGLAAELDRIASPKPLEKGLVLRVAGSDAEQPAELRVEVRADARLDVVWMAHALVGATARELHREPARAPCEVGVIAFKREVVRFLDAALASSYRAA
jgi:hypothetical protein